MDNLPADLDASLSFIVVLLNSDTDCVDVNV